MCTLTSSLRNYTIDSSLLVKKKLLSSPFFFGLIAPHDVNAKEVGWSYEICSEIG